MPKTDPIISVAELRRRAAQEVQELGDPPDDPTDRPRWVEERRGAIELLAALAAYDRALLHEAAELPAGEAPTARDLLLEAAEVSPQD